MTFRLVPYEPGDAATIAGWIQTPEEAARWASIDRLPDAATFERWHAEPDVVPFTVHAADGIVAYGELWEDRHADEAELARLVVDPASRGRGIGRTLARALADEAWRRGFGAVWLRVVPSNVAALAAYTAAGFVRAGPEEEAEFNVGQPLAYLWLRDITR
jgi:ribosomal protein S18 acetylase RimI-like enzyme